ncbi:hypothetical protein [Actinomadura rupiterrae]|uniref:hypothetical protein n=1 Tax=Actinomadura rupiterrae TaxID=559627 RepID=UPI0020A3D8FC|nr:hypothetical protein [Actinomadura rupiterrae]MCP2342594.1 hypothetical protein [Actinomadura rupiterrae]
MVEGAGDRPLLTPRREIFGHSLAVFGVDPSGLDERDHRASLELFATDVAPVLRTAPPVPPD